MQYSFRDLFIAFDKKCFYLTDCQKDFALVSHKTAAV